jgi:hypothetical protein
MSVTIEQSVLERVDRIGGEVAKRDCGKRLETVAD